MRKGKGSTTKATHGDRNIEALHKSRHLFILLLHI